MEDVRLFALCVFECFYHYFSTRLYYIIGIPKIPAEGVSNIPKYHCE